MAFYQHIYEVDVSDLSSIKNLFSKIFTFYLHLFFSLTLFVNMFVFTQHIFTKTMEFIDIILINIGFKSKAFDENPVSVVLLNNEEQHYLDVLEKVLKEGTVEKGRNGNTISIFGESLRFSLKDGVIPILTTKKVAWKTCLKELLWFISGQTDTQLLKDQNVHIWDDNTTREFLDSRGLKDLKEGLIGPGYGYQWRFFNSPYNKQSGEPFSETNGVDQLQQIIDQLKDPEKRTSRRLIMTAWNPVQVDQMALPPCHILAQFNVHDGNKLSCALYQRSCDFPVGSPFNITSYSFLTHLLAKHCGLEAHEFIYFMGNVHIYEEHISAVEEQLSRVPTDMFPTLEIKEKKDNISDYVVDDFVVSNYKSQSAIKMKMVA